MTGETDQTLQPWQVLSSSYSMRDPWLSVRSDRVRLPDGAELPAYHVIELADWVSCIAVTADLEVVLIEQYRHPVGQSVLEFPAGAVEARDSSAESAMRRELMEETGFESDDWRLIGNALANPARQTNRSLVFLALGARKVAEPKLERGESIRTRLLGWEQFRRSLASGAVQLPGQHVACLFWLQAFASRSSDPAHRRLALV
jgi:ADP-ribose pyrophosphatase